MKKKIFLFLIPALMLAQAAFAGYKPGLEGLDFFIPAAAPASGDDVSVDSASTTDPDFVSTGDIDFTNTSNTITADLNDDVVGTAHMADADHGDFTYSSGSATLDADSVADNEIDYTNVTLSDFTIDAASYDFGGADDLEIPNGTGPTVDTAGQVAIDTTGDDLIFYGGSKRSLTPKMSFSIPWDAPADADSRLLFKAQYAFTITDVHGIVDPADTGESVVFDIQECDSAGDNCATIDATITADNDGAEDDGSLTNGTIDAGDWVLLDIGTVTGTVSQLTATVYYTKDAE